MEVRSVGRDDFFSGGASCCLLATSSGLVFVSRLTTPVPMHCLFVFQTFVTCRSQNEFPLPSFLQFFGIAAELRDYQRFHTVPMGPLPPRWHGCNR